MIWELFILNLKTSSFRDFIKNLSIEDLNRENAFELKLQKHKKVRAISYVPLAALNSLYTFNTTSEKKVHINASKGRLEWLQLKDAINVMQKQTAKPLVLG